MKKLSLLLFLINFLVQSEAQHLNLYQMYTMTDSRDNNEYNIIRIGDTHWFQDNLRYESKFSFCPNVRNSEKCCGDGNFYSYTELDTICPKGWRIPTVAEWESYFNFKKKGQAVSDQEIRYDTLLKPESKLDLTNNTITVLDTSHKINLLDPSNMLRLKPCGWVEGKRRRNKKTLTLWARNEAIEDMKYHLHIGNNGYVKHSHVHHIDDKKKKRRKFIVRCVCEKENEL